MPKLDAILFDLGHTLIDFRASKESLLEVYAEVHRRLAAFEGMAIPPVEDLAELLPKEIDDIIDLSYHSATAIEEIDMRTVMVEAFRAHHIELPAAAIDEMVLLQHRSLTSSMVLADGAPEVLDMLKTLGFKLAIVSNATNLAPLLRRDLEQLAILRYFDATVFSSELGLRKPHPQIYQSALHGIGSTATSAIFVGDRIREDIVGPQALGMSAILTHQFRQESPNGARPAWIIRDIQEILKIIPAIDR